MLLAHEIFYKRYYHDIRKSDIHNYEYYHGSGFVEYISIHITKIFLWF